MKKLNKDFLDKFNNKVESLPSSFPLDGGIYKNISERVIFVGRLGLFNLKNKYFKLKVGGKIYYAAFFVQSIKHTSSNFVTHRKVCGIEYMNTWSGIKYRLSFHNVRLEYQELILTRNDLYSLEYEEISLEDYKNVVELFF